MDLNRDPRRNGRSKWTTTTPKLKDKSARLQRFSIHYKVYSKIRSPLKAENKGSKKSNSEFEFCPFLAPKFQYLTIFWSIHDSFSNHCGL